MIFEKKKGTYTNDEQAAFSAPTASVTPVVHELQQNSEWRFEVAIGQTIDVKVSKKKKECMAEANAL